MAQLIADRRDIDFLLHEVLNVEQFSRHDRFADFNRKTVDMVVSEARNFAVKEMLPTWKEGDEQGCSFEAGKVTIPESFHRLYQLFNDGEWLSMNEDPEWGGQGMPKSVSSAASEYFNGANFPFMMYPSLTHGAGKLVEEFGTEEQKKTYLKNLYTGKWTGTMLLTEAGAGSDVGALETTARKNPDGTYSITGTKIFISGGDHELAENIVHPVLARIEGAPAGTKGISLFLVPKFRVNPDGTPGAFNDVVCTGIEHKMGIHGSSTCTLTLGGSGQCLGTLLGEENKGMKAMFVMMNEARLLVGMQGFSCATTAYMYAVNYAKERVQGASLVQPNEGGVPIIRHPDVRRQLLTMKSYVEGMRTLLYFVGYCNDMVAVAGDQAVRERYQGLIEILTPLAKGYVTDKAFEVCNHAIQVYGGYGYVEEYPVAQLMRDCRITQIYEGTNGIQAMDLLGRKLGMNKGAVVMDLIGEIKKTLRTAKEIEFLAPHTQKVGAALEKLGAVAQQLGKTAASDRVLYAFAHAYPFLEVTGDVIVAWLLLWRGTVAAQKLGSAKGKDVPFYEGILKSLEFFTTSVLPVTLGKMEAINGANGACVEISEESFNG
ncbi:acyl-CoA dehydrogenase [Geomonas azotofigens]|uniref:acyl-CoA dehydrogenase n=1 Tax=Geomonas azotofigens TaxID=2843196 RepID=UPI001C10FB17|nr:acyl-CoA dehydrogenase [Geomonas azotofigens]MBU5613829.1 acyl-CoA dehydrogenase [Geomonas azotofigens]